ncbi:putative exonuclease GOR [Macrobrachium nipponense]|uniref:putative exonuclease GOR n=1 Tax=Macrobrachium nipponense TaxID=159736 RepID=UPI0030C84F8F
MTEETYKKLWRLKLHQLDLETYGFPRNHPNNPKRAVLGISQRPQPQQEPHESDSSDSEPEIIMDRCSRICTRCRILFKVDKEGRPKRQLCRYHPYHVPYKKKFRCCGRKKHAEEGPCKTARQHVHNQLAPEALENFKPTRDNLIKAKRIYALKCSHVYTEKGIEVASVSLVDAFCSVVYETKVRPESNILDYDTEISGLRRHDLANIQKTLQDVIEDLNALIGPKTILVGFRLQRDLTSLRMIHENIVEVTVLYPHKWAPRRTHSLYFLRRNFLSLENIRAPLKSREEAITAMKLALHRM